MRVEGVVVVEPAGQLSDVPSGVGLLGDGDLVALHGAHEPVFNGFWHRSFAGWLRPIVREFSSHRKSRDG